MNSPEKPGPTPPQESPTKPEAELEQLRRTENKALIEFASSELPKIKPGRSGRVAKLITLFSLATALVSEHGPSDSFEGSELAAAINKNLPHPNAEEANALTKELIKNVMENSPNAPHVGGLLFGHIEAYNDGSKDLLASDDTRGKLPTKAKNVLIRGGSMSNENLGQTNETVSINSSVRSVFAVAGIAQGYEVVPTGEPQTLSGYGRTENEALQHGLEGSAGFYGLNIKTATSLDSKTVSSTHTKTVKSPAGETVSSTDGSRFTEHFDQHHQSLYGQPFCSYQLVESKKMPDGQYKVKILVQPGQVIEAPAQQIEELDKPPEIIIGPN